MGRLISQPSQNFLRSNLVKSHCYLKDVAIADIAFEASGETPGEMFEASAQALMGTMVDLQHIKPEIKKTIHLENEHLDQLLFDWLSELVYLKDAEGLLFNQFKVSLISDPTWRLSGIVMGESIDPNRHDLYVDVKAVTYHLFDISHRDEGWTARVVLDI